jgi:hypothetical protein
MKKLLSPKTDIVFKMLFETDEEILADLIDNVLDRPANRRVCFVRVKSPQILPDEHTRFCFLPVELHPQGSMF